VRETLNCRIVLRASYFTHIGHQGWKSWRNPFKLVDKIQRTAAVPVRPPAPCQLDEHCGKYGRTSCVHLYEVWLSLHWCVQNSQLLSSVTFRFFVPNFTLTIPAMWKEEVEIYSQPKVKEGGHSVFRELTLAEQLSVRTPVLNFMKI